MSTDESKPVVDEVEVPKVAEEEKAEVRPITYMHVTRTCVTGHYSGRHTHQREGFSR
jgi:hypothetical protein